MAMDAWIRTYDEDVDITGLTMLQLVTLHEAWRHQQHGAVSEATPDDPSLIQKRGNNKKHAGWLKKKNRHSSHIYYFASSNGYRVELNWSRMNITTQYTTLDDAINFHDAMLNMRATAGRRVMLEKQAKGQHARVEPLSRDEVVVALSEQPSMRLFFRCYAGPARWSPMTRNLNLVISHWHLKPDSFITLKGKFDNNKWYKVKDKMLADSIKVGNAHMQRTHALIENIRKQMLIKAGQFDGIQACPTMIDILENGRLKEQIKALNAVNGFLNGRIKDLEANSRRALDVTPASSHLRMVRTPPRAISNKPMGWTPPQGTSVAAEPIQKGKGSSSQKAPQAAASAAKRARTEKAGQLSKQVPLTPPGADDGNTTPQQVSPSAFGPWQTGAELAQNAWRLLHPGLSVEEGRNVLKCLTLSELNVLQNTSQGMQASGKKEVSRRLRVFSWAPELYGFSARQQTLRGRKVRPVNQVPQIIERMTNFLQHFAHHIEDLWFEAAPCEVLEDPRFVDMLSIMQLKVATFPQDGWSNTTSKRKIIQVLKSGVHYMFVNKAGDTKMEGVK